MDELEVSFTRGFVYCKHEIGHGIEEHSCDGCCKTNKKLAKKIRGLFGKREFHTTLTPSSRLSPHAEIENLAALEAALKEKPVKPRKVVRATSAIAAAGDFEAALYKKAVALNVGGLKFRSPDFVEGARWGNSQTLAAVEKLIDDAIKELQPNACTTLAGSRIDELERLKRKLQALRAKKS